MGPKYVYWPGPEWQKLKFWLTETGVSFRQKSSQAGRSTLRRQRASVRSEAADARVRQ
jgi:hypothetical protein